MLGKNKFYGRNKDETAEEILKSFGAKGNQEDDRVRLVHVDKKGHALTQKEAFRQMCWKFHGKMPSHKKQEKRKAKEEIENKINQISIGLNPQAKVPSVAKKLGNLGNLGSLSSGTKKPKKI
jgi:U4/U6.U5 tri-snRNP-associated protein 1